MGCRCVGPWFGAPVRGVGDVPAYAAWTKGRVPTYHPDVKKTHVGVPTNRS
jgi:hypothetical protein